MGTLIEVYHFIQDQDDEQYVDIIYNFDNWGYKRWFTQDRFHEQNDNYHEQLSKFLLIVKPTLLLKFDPDNIET